MARAPSLRRGTALFRLQPADRLMPGTPCPAFPVTSCGGSCLSEPRPAAFTWSRRPRRSARAGVNRMGHWIFDPVFPGPLGFGQAERHCGTLAAGMPPDLSEIDRPELSAAPPARASPSISLKSSQSFLSSHSRFQEQAACAAVPQPRSIGRQTQATPQRRNS